MQKRYVSGVAAAIAIAAALYLLQTGAPSFLKPNPRQDSTGRLRVVATFFPLYDFTRAIGKDRIDLSLLFTQTPEIASFAPGDVQKINDADLVIKNGLGLEPILDDLLAASDNKDIAAVDTSVKVRRLPLSEPDERADADPHIWLNPQNAILQVGTIRNALIQADPINTEFYANNAAEYIAELERIDREIESEVTRLPQKDFVAFHSAFRYFAERYGLRQVAVIEGSPGKEPSPRYIADVIKIIRDTDVKAIFSEPQFSPRVLEAIARDTGRTVYALDPIETGDPGNDSYVSLMRRNLETLKEAMR